MTRWITLSASLLLFSLWAGPLFAATIPKPLTGVVMSVTATKDPGTGLFTYRYRVFNPETNDGELRSVAIELTRRAGNAALSREGLVNGPGYLPFGSADTFARVPMVPVGMSGPEGWLMQLALSEGREGEAPDRGLARWGTRAASFHVMPGSVKHGFELTSYGLPGVRPAEIERDVDLELLPDEFEGDPDKTHELEQQLILRLKTVGPQAPPQTFVPLEFLNYLITLLHDSRQQGWVKVDGIHQSLLAKLLAAKRSLEAGQNQAANGQMKAFLNEVRAVSCPEFACPGNKPLTSEAFALLFFNGEYLLDRLPGPGGTR